MVKRLPNWLKIGLQSRFGPNFIVEFEAFFRKKFGLAYWTVTEPELESMKVATHVKHVFS